MAAYTNPQAVRRAADSLLSAPQNIQATQQMWLARNVS
jgi:hypothetical protein